MTTYTVVFPITGTASCTVVAESEEEAIEMAWQQPHELENWESHECIVQGNVFYGDTNEIEVQAHEDEE
jgi:hypothetical protein